MPSFRIVVCAAAALALSGPAWSKETKPGLGIEAIVGSEAISSFDVDNRIKFILATTQLSNTPDVLAQIRPRVIYTLVDERLQVQEAARRNISVTDQEVDAAIASIEQNRGMPEGAIFRQLEEKKVPKETFVAQIRAQLSWNKLLSRVVRPTIRIGDEEIALAEKKLSAPSVNQELKIGVLSIPVDKPSGAEQARNLAEKLAKEIRRGASFEEISRQFGRSAIGEAQAFWVKPQQLDAKVARALEGAKPGTITSPVMTETGITVVKVYDAKAVTDEKAPEVEVALKEILLRLKPEASSKEAGVLLQIGEEVAKNPGTCQEKGIASIDNLQDFAIEVEFIRSLLSELPPAVKIIAENLKAGDISTPFATSEGIRLYMLCERKTAETATDRSRVANILFQQRMELEAQKYLRNLRRNTYIEVR